MRIQTGSGAEPQPGVGEGAALSERSYKKSPRGCFLAQRRRLRTEPRYGGTPSRSSGALAGLGRAQQVRTGVRRVWAELSRSGQSPVGFLGGPPKRELKARAREVGAFSAPGRARRSRQSLVGLGLALAGEAGSEGLSAAKEWLEGGRCWGRAPAGLGRSPAGVRVILEKGVHGGSPLPRAFRAAPGGYRGWRGSQAPSPGSQGVGPPWQVQGRPWRVQGWPCAGS